MKCEVGRLNGKVSTLKYEVRSMSHEVWTMNCNSEVWSVKNEVTTDLSKKTLGFADCLLQNISDLYALVCDPFPNHN